MIRDLLIYYSKGEDVFGTFVQSYLESVQLGSPSKLADLMSEHGSDKGTWHSYPLFYEKLLEQLPGQPQDILEIGIGSNNVAITGNMGVEGIPGASLRAWRDFLPGTRVYGADYDPGCLFEERDIHTFFFDQHDVNTINAVWSITPHLHFDLVVDDGAHTYEANTNTLDATYARVRPGGFYVIEDIVMTFGNLGRYDAYFHSRGWDALLMRLPHAKNATDNVVAVIRPNPLGT